MFYFAFRCVVLIPLLRWLFRPRVQGMEHLPETGAAIIAGNHLSFADHFMMPTMVKRRISFLAKMEYFTGRGLKGRFSATFFRALGAIPVDRSGKEAAQAAVDTGLRVLARGELLGIYPEGTRSHDGRLYKGRVGVAAMALRSGAPVIPCAMIGTFEAQPTGRRLPRLVPITIRFGAPLDFSRYAGMEDQRAVLRAVTDEIMYAILKLSEQEYVDTYATDARAALKAVHPPTDTPARPGSSRPRLAPGSNHPAAA
ncbi:lysophospholipid acyltransferase family protein [Streptomyces sp. NPDC002537]